MRGHKRFHQDPLQEENRRQNPQRKPSRRSLQTKTAPGNTPICLYSCPLCKMPYNYTIQNGEHAGRVPLILNCRHSMCQKCIQLNMNRSSLICPECSFESPSPINNTLLEIQKTFPPNFYILGHILWFKPNCKNNLEGISLLPSSASLKNRMQSEVSSHSKVINKEKCSFAVCKKLAEMFCPECEEVYCKDCSIVVHKSSKTAWLHKPIPYIVKFELEPCPNHPNMENEFFCNTCHLSACCYCILEFHEGHEKWSVDKLTEEETIQLGNLKESGLKVLKHLLASKKVLENYVEKAVHKLDQEISSSMAQFHAKLHCAELKMRSRLQKDDLKNVNVNVSSAMTRITSSIARVVSILSALETKEKKINMKALLKQLEDVVGTPCRLNKEPSSEDIKLFKDSVLENIENLFEIALSTSSSEDFQLLPFTDQEELSDDPEIESAVASLLKIDPKSSKSSSLSKTKSSVTSETSKISQNTIKSFNEYEKIFVTHIESLDCIYVQPQKTHKAFVRFNSDLQKFAEEKSQVEPQINETYLVQIQNNAKATWFRGRVEDIIEVVNVKKYKVFLIDYGSTHTVGIEQIAPIGDDLLKKKPFVIQCRLWNFGTFNWNKHAHVHLGKIIFEKEIAMNVKSSEGSVLDVELFVPGSNGNLVTVADILMYSFSDVKDCDQNLPHQMEPSKQKQINKVFENSVKFVVSQSADVVIIYMKDPEHIFVILNENLKILRQMQEEMKKHYKNPKRDRCIPVKDSYAVVKSNEVQGEWHRVYIKSVDPIAEKAFVKFLDAGLEAHIAWIHIRSIVESFTRLECQAIKVSLADIAPVTSEGWSDHARIRLMFKGYESQTLKMIVHKVDPLKVALFIKKPSLDVCLNALLVEEKLATSSGQISTVLNWPHTSEDIEMNQEEAGFVKEQLSRIDLDAIESDSHLYKTKHKVEIVKLVSPKLIYVQFCSRQEQKTSMMKELQIYYSKEREVKDSWDEEEPCVVFNENQFTRGLIKAKLLDDRYKIYLFDEVIEVIREKGIIYKYSQYFTKFPSFTYKCYLANISPAGGGEVWPKAATEILLQIFADNKDIYMTKVVGDVTDRLMPVVMWYKKNIWINPLEPIREKYVSLINLLMYMGLAFKGKEAFKSLNEDEDRTEKDFDVEMQKEDEELESSNSMEVEEGKSIEEVQVQSWLPPQKWIKFEFDAVITCLDDIECNVFLYDKEYQTVYEEMEKSIQKHFAAFPPKTGLCWKEGQICMLKYDKKWYRAVVNEIIGYNEIVVRMIDFGDFYTVGKEDLTNEVMYLDIPTIVTRTVLHNVQPASGMWTEAHYKFILRNIVDNAKVVVKSDPDAPIPEVELWTRDGVCLNKLFVDFNDIFKAPISDEDVIIEEVICIKPENPPLSFKNEPFNPKILKCFTEMTIVNILSHNSVAIRYAEDTSQLIEVLTGLEKEILNTAPELPDLKNFELNTPCICKYNDGFWYRARIIDNDNLNFGYVTVFFVDYGNTESVYCSDMKVMKPDWFKININCYEAQLNFNATSDVHSSHIKGFLKQFLDKTVLVKIIKEMPLVIEIYNKDKVLSYSPLILTGIIKRNI